MFRSKKIILREYACTLLKSLNYLKDLKSFFKFKTLNLKSRWLIPALWQQYCSRCVL